ncbi:TPA: hypothetical protein I7679_20550 [Vibrio vulnificus]|nr:hypothetical protein [Vibrio vulnificus]
MNSKSVISSKNILDAIKGDYEWKNVKTIYLIPLSITDLVCIFDASYDEVNNVVKSLVDEKKIFSVNHRYHCLLK